MELEQLYTALDEAWDREDCRELIIVYGTLIRDWEGDQPLHYSGLATAQLFYGDIEEAENTLRYLDENVTLSDKAARKDRDLAWGYLLAERANLAFQGTDTEDGIAYRYPISDRDVEEAEKWLEKAEHAGATDSYLKDRIKTIRTIVKAYKKEQKGRRFVGSKPVLVGGALLAFGALLYAFNVYPARSSSQRFERMNAIPEQTISWIAGVIEQPSSFFADFGNFIEGFVNDFPHHIQLFWPGLLYLFSFILYWLVNTLPAKKAGKALDRKAAKARGRWKEFQGALNTQNTRYRETTTTHYSDGSTRRSTRIKSDDAQGRAIRSVGCMHFFSYIFRLLLLPLLVLVDLYRHRIRS